MPLSEAQPIIDGHWRQRGGSQARPAYFRRVLALRPIAYWPLADADVTTAVDMSGNGYNGTYTGIAAATGIGDGLPSALFAGAAPRLSVFSAGFASAFNGDLGTVMLWFRPTSTAVWSDGINRRLWVPLTNVSNRFIFEKNAAPANRVRISRIAAGTNVQLGSIDISTSVDGWTCGAAWWDGSQGQFFINGVATAAPVTANTAFVSPITQAVIGAADTGGSTPWSGSIAHVAVWGRVLTAAEIAALAIP